MSTVFTATCDLSCNIYCFLCFPGGIQINLEGKTGSSWEVVSKGFFHASPHYVHTHLSILINIMLVTSSLYKQEDRTENKGAVLIQVMTDDATAG